jgi:type IV secretion system protein VirD4
VQILRASMIPGTSGDPSEDVLATVTAMLDAPATELRISSGDLLGLIDKRQLEVVFTKLLGERPGMVDTILVAMQGMSRGEKAGTFDILPSAQTLGMVLGHFKIERDKYKHDARRRALLGVLNRFVISRPMLTLTDREKGLLRGAAAMFADGGLSLVAWHRLYVLMTWGGGSALVAMPGDAKGNPNAVQAEEVLKSLVSSTLPTHEQVLSEIAATMTRYQARSDVLQRVLSECLNPGARWFEERDLATTRIYDAAARREGLVLGYLGSKHRPITFSGNESLISIGGPGTGKTQAQVIPNLLSYPGSAFVLDVKGELWAATSDHRAKHFGPVFRFAPTDLAGGTHHYNPFDMIGDTAAQAAVDAQVLANELIPESTGTDNKYWDIKARHFVWALAVAVALGAPEQRNLGELSKLLAMQANFEADPDSYDTSQTRRIVEKLKALAVMASLPDLAQTATAIEGGLMGNRLESVLDGARAHLSPITRTPSAMAAMATSDWHPLDLRNKPGMTVYLCLKPGDLRAFAPLVRLIFQQHVTALTKEFVRTEARTPVTFFLDEMPQLGLMPGLSDIIDIGRSAGLRLWMFAQYLGQIRSIYGARADGLINACAVRCFLQPDLDAANFIAPQLGARTNLFTGERRPLAESHELMGRAYADKVIMLSRGDYPASLNKRYAHEMVTVA